MRALVAEHVRGAAGYRRARLGIQEYAVVANAEEARQLVAHHDDGYPEALPQSLDQIVEVPGRDRIQSCRRLVEEQYLRIQRQRAGETDALAHASAQIGGHAIPTCLQGNLLEVLRAQILEAEQVVKTREAELELARIDLGYTRIVSPADGQLSERESLSGEYVTPGSKIGLVVPLPNVWVVANFRESQIAHMYPGQPAVVTVDSVPDTEFRGSVDSFEPASGALQALLPPDNATGNFTKVAQRFAVKVILVPGQSAIRRLRPGMSAIVTVAVGETRQERSSAR
jgi:multidrug resistance efflux pump